MQKTFEQILLEGQAAGCKTEEELFLLWQLMQQMEENPEGTTGYADIDKRNFHIDGIVSEQDFTGTLYILKETNMKSHIKKGQSFPVIYDVRKDFRSGKSAFGEAEYMEYLAGMQKILEGGEEKASGNFCAGLQSCISISAAEKALPTKSACSTASITSNSSSARSSS